MLSLINRRNWQQGKMVRVVRKVKKECETCAEHEDQIAKLKKDLREAKMADNDYNKRDDVESQVEMLENKVASLMSQNENLMKTIQEMIMAKKANEISPIPTSAANGKTTKILDAPVTQSKTPMRTRSGRFVKAVVPVEEADVESESSSSSSEAASVDCEESALRDEPNVQRCLWKELHKPRCDLSFKSPREMGLHVRTVHLPTEKSGIRCRWQGCRLKGRPFNRVPDLAEHVFQHTSERPFLCKAPGCGRSFVTAYNLEHHVGQHPSRKRALSPEPPASIPRLPPTPLPLVNGQGTQKGKKVAKERLRCDVCFKVASTQYNLGRHMRTHKTEHQSTLCPSCQRNFSSYHSMQRHRERCESARVPPRTERARGVACPEGEMRVHPRTSLGVEKPIGCGYPGCDRTFAQPAHLHQHEVVHERATRDRDGHECPTCGKSLKTKKSLQYHERTHMAKKLLRCMDPNCRRTFVSQDSYRLHMRTHMGMWPFVCPLSACKAKFTTKKSVKSHLLHVHSGKSTACKVGGCNDTFPTYEMCVDHCMTAHADRYENPEADGAMAPTHDSSDSDVVVIPDDATPPQHRPPIYSVA